MEWIYKAGWEKNRLACNRGVDSPSKETHMKHLNGIKGSSVSKVMQPTAQLKHLYMNTHSTGNKHKELQVTDS